MSFEDRVPDGVVLHREGGLANGAVGHEDAHRDPELFHGLGDALLVLEGMFFEAVVFPGSEATIGGELQLGDGVGPGGGLEHVEVGAVLEFEVVFAGGGLAPFGLAPFGFARLPPKGIEDVLELADLILVDGGGDPGGSEGGGGGGEEAALRKERRFMSS